MRTTVVDESRQRVCGDRRYDVEALVENLAAAGIIRDETTVRVISRWECNAHDFMLPRDENKQQWLNQTCSAVYAFTYDTEEDLLILEVD